MPDSQADDTANYRYQRGANWEPDNVRTILQWIHVGAINLDVMSEATFQYKRVIRRHTILSLILSTLASTASLSQFNLSEASYPTLTVCLKVFFTAMAALVAISTGYIKVYQIQEKLEKAIKLQQEWTSFGSVLTSELQLPLHMRKDALYLIVKHKDTYTELFKQQVDVSKRIVSRVALRNGLDVNALSLSELFERVLETEAERIQMPAELATTALTPSRRVLYEDGGVVMRPSSLRTAPVLAPAPPVPPSIPGPTTAESASANSVQRRITSIMSEIRGYKAPQVLEQRQKISQFLMSCAPSTTTPARPLLRRSDSIQYTSTAPGRHTSSLLSSPPASPPPSPPISPAPPPHDSTLDVDIKR